LGQTERGSRNKFIFTSYTIMVCLGLWLCFFPVVHRPVMQVIGFVREKMVVRGYLISTPWKLKSCKLRRVLVVYISSTPPNPLLHLLILWPLYRSGGRDMPPVLPASIPSIPYHKSTVPSPVPADSPSFPSHTTLLGLVLPQSSPFNKASIPSKSSTASISSTRPTSALLRSNSLAPAYSMRTSLAHVGGR